MDSLTSAPSFDFTDGVSSGAGFSFGEGLSSIKQTYSDQLTMPPYFSFGRFIYDRTDGSSVQYQIQNSGIKEEIVLNSRPDTNTISFDLNLGTSTLRKEADGYHVISDAAEDLYTILNPNVHDSAGKTGEISMDAAGSRATLTVNADFLSHASYPVVIDPTTVASGASRTGYAMQRKIFWDGSRYFLFYSNGANFYYRSSSDGITWSAAQLSFAGVQGRDLAIWNNGADVYAAYVTSTYDISVRKGTISGTTISWGTAYLALNGTSATSKYDIPAITRDSSGKLWLSSRYYNGTSYVVKAVCSTTADSPAAWGTVSTLSTTSNTSSSLFPSGVALDSGKMLFFWNRGTTYEARYFDGSAFASVMTVGSSPSTESDTYAPTAVVDQAGKVYMGYINSSIKAAYKMLASPYSSSGLSAESVFSNSEAGYVSLSLDSLGGEVYGFYTNMLGGLEDEVRMKRLSDGAEVLLSDTANRGFDKVQLYSSAGGTWQDKTTEAASAATSDVKHSSSSALLATTSDAIQVGDRDKFGQVAIHLSTPASGISGLSVTYWNGSSWVTLSFTDATSNLSLLDGAITFTAPSDWAKDADGLYSIKIKALSTPGTPKPIGSVVNNFPLSRYVSSPYTVQGRPYAFWMDGQNSESFSIKYAQAQTSGSLAGASRAPQVTEDMKTASLSVNTANGNAAVSFSDLSTPARGFAAALSHTYNSRAAVDSAYGYNWSLSPEEALDTRNPDGSLSYHSPDGHIYRFDLVSGSYIAEKGFYLTLVKNWDGTYTLKDKGSNLTNFSSAGVLTTKADRNGNTTTYAHDSCGRLTSVTDSAAQVTTLAYQSGAAGRLSSISAPGSRSMSFTYDSSTGDLLSYTNAEGRTTSFAYDASHQMTQVTDPRSGVYNLYYSKSRLTKIERPAVPDLGVTSQNIAYNEADTQVTDPNGNSTTYAVSPFGDALGALDADGLSSGAAFDAAGNNTSSLSYKDKALADNFDTDTIGSYTFSGGGATSYDSVNKYLSLTTGDNLTRTMDISQESTATAVRLQGSFYVKAKYPSTGTLELRFRKKANGDYYSFTAPIDRLAATLSKKSGGVTTTLASSPNVRVREAISGGASDRWHTIAAEVENGKVRGYLDGKEVVTATDSSISEGGSFSIIASQIDVYLDDLRVHEGAMATSAAYDANGNKTSATDQMDMTSYTAYEANLPTHSWDDLGRHRYSTYDAKGNKLTDKDPLNNITTYSYNPSNGDLLSTIDPRTFETTYTHEPGRGFVTEIHHPNGGTSRSEYDSMGMETTSTDALGRETIHTHDEMGRETETEYPGGAKTFAEYDEVGNKVKESRLADLALADFEADDTWSGGSTDTPQFHQGASALKLTSSDGSVAETYKSIGDNTDLAGEAAASGYIDVWVYTDDPTKLDTNNALTLRVETAAGAFVYAAGSSEFTTGWSLLHISKSFFQSEGAPSWEVVTTLRLLAKSKTGQTGNVWADDLRLVKSKRIIQQTNYDALGRPLYKTDALGQLTANSYAAKGEKLSEEGPDGKRTYSYDVLGRRIESLSGEDATTTTAYDAAGNEIASYSDDNLSMSYEYDIKGRQLKQTDSEQATTSFDYDAAGNVIKETKDETATITKEYDALNRLISLTDETSQTTYNEYDQAGNLTQTTKPDGTVSTSVYDSMGRVLAQTEGTATITYTYDLAGNRLSESSTDGDSLTNIYGVAGRLSSTTDSSGTVMNFLYDTQGNKIREAEGTETVDYTYDELGRQTKVVYSDGRIVCTAPAGPSATESIVEEGETIDMSYNTSGYLNTLSVAGAGPVSYTYDSRGNRISMDQANGAKTNYRYYSNNEIYSLETSTTAGRILRYDYRYDTRQNLILEKRDGASLNYYAYDATNQLIKWTAPDDTVTDYSYDAARRISTSGDKTYSYDTRGRLSTITSPAGTTTYRYTSANDLGRVYAPDGTRVLTWDVRHRLRQSSNGSVDVSYQYNSDGTIIRRTTGGVSTWLVLRNGKFVTEKDASGQILVRYYYDDKGLPAYMRRVEADGLYHTYYFHLNHRGDVMKLTNNIGTVVASYSYDPWGKILESTGTMANGQPFRFRGMYWDDQAQLYLDEMYDPSVGQVVGNSSAYNGNSPTCIFPVRVKVHDTRAGSPNTGIIQQTTPRQPRNQYAQPVLVRVAVSQQSVAVASSVKMSLSSTAISSYNKAFLEATSYMTDPIRIVLHHVSVKEWFAYGPAETSDGYKDRAILAAVTSQNVWVNGPLTDPIGAWYLDGSSQDYTQGWPGGESVSQAAWAQVHFRYKCPPQPLGIPMPPDLYRHTHTIRTTVWAGGYAEASYDIQGDTLNGSINPVFWTFRWQYGWPTSPPAFD